VYVSNSNLKIILSLTGSPYNFFRTGVMRSVFFMYTVNPAAVFCSLWSFSISREEIP